MSNARRTSATKPKPKPKQTGPAAPELDIPLPGGGRAIFYAESELTPRRTRALDVQLTRLGPRMQELAAAQQVTAADGTVDTRAVLPGPAAHLTEEEAEAFNELNDLAAWVYLKERRDAAGRKLPELESVDDVLDLPKPIYRAIVNHAAELVGASMTNQFSIDTLPDDIDEADPDLPTSA